jgi:Arm DNA-binding domain
MAKLTKRTIDAAEAQDKDYVIWDDELPGFGPRVFTSGKRSYLIQYRSAGRSRRYTIERHGVWTPELARKEAKVQLGRVAQGDNPAEERQLDHKAITVKELCDLYLNDLKAGLILGKGGRPKKPTTIVTDTGRIHRHILPLIGTRRVKDLVKADVNKVLKDIMSGKTRVSVKTKKLRGRAIVRGGVGTATRTVGLLGGILTYAVGSASSRQTPRVGPGRGALRTKVLSAPMLSSSRSILLRWCRSLRNGRRSPAAMALSGSCHRLANSRVGASSVTNSICLSAEYSPFDLKESLKRRGYAGPTEATADRDPGTSTCRKARWRTRLRSSGPRSIRATWSRGCRP